MGGDYAPAAVVQGAVDALRERQGRLHVILVGQNNPIQSELSRLKDFANPLLHARRLVVQHASEIIDMHDSPTAALKTKKDSSIAVGLRMVREGAADSFVSAGNTGAVFSASTLILGRIPNVGRPTMGAIIPTAKRPCLLIDAGANVDCKPRHLMEFGIMGSIYLEALLGVPTPRVGLLNIGEEESKGNETVQAAHLLMKNRPGLNFVGNIEGRDVLKGDIDVVVCDGFVGNILLKFGESVPSFIKAKFVAMAEHSIVNKLVAVIARGSLRGALKELDYQEAGGVPVLGVDGISVIGHGRSTPKAIKNMIFRGQEMAEQRVHKTIEQAIEKLRSTE